tara:strand:+ start:4665 stop:6152 length:1488 start_codon:yes stop_codon:yes gene_type:complete
MDAKETLTIKPSCAGKSSLIPKIPLVGIVIALIASTAFYLSRMHDQQVWQALHGYHEENLLEKEEPLYLDFYQKRLAIEQKGSKAQVTLIKNAISRKDKKALSHIILSDRSFRTYLSQKASIYFSPKQQELWIKHNSILTAQLSRLSTYRFALIPEIFIVSPSLANLVTYNFIDNRIESFLSNILIFLLLCAIAENFIRRSVILGAFFISSITYAGTYLFIADSFTAPLQTLNGVVYFFGFAIISAFVKSQYPEKFRHSKRYFVIALLLLGFKIIVDVYFNVFSLILLIGLIPLCISGVLLGWFSSRFTLKNQDQLSTETHLQALLPKKSRHQYAEALTGLNRFNFKYARQVLQVLRTEHPDSLRILESSYHLEKLKPDEPSFWALAEARIENCLITQNYPEMLLIFQDIQKAAPSRDSASKHISTDHYLKILIVFIRHGNTEKAEHAFMFLELAGNQTLIKEACKLLIDVFSQKQDVQKKAHYLALLESYVDVD